MNSLVFARYEILRTFRNRRFFILSLGFPLVLYLLIAAPNRNEHDFGSSGLSAPLYLMVGLASFGTMNSMLASGARIAAERGLGWNRQLRLTPLSPRNYFRTKVFVGYLTALCTIIVLYAAGISMGVSLPASEWLAMTGLMLVALLPFAGIGILMGQLLTSDSIGPAIGGTGALFAFLGGSWFPVTGGTLRDIAQILPSFWLVQASHVALHGPAWRAKGWLVIAVWTVATATLAARAYQRNTTRP